MFTVTKKNMEYKTITPLARRLDKVLPSATLALTQRARELKAEGHDVLSLTAGEPDLPPAEHIIEATKQALDDGQTRYTHVGGIQPLREAVQSYYQNLDGLKYELNEIIVSSGAKQAIFNAMQALLNPGDEVIVISPYWVSYPDIVRLAGGTPIIIETTEAQGFLLRPDQLEAAITEKTKAIILNSPSNPTGACYSESDLQNLVTILEAHPKIVILADDIYRRFSYASETAASLLSVAPQLQSRTLLIDGCSKTYAMTGFRIGWTLGPRNIISAMSRVQGQSTSSPASPSQFAALAAITGDQTWVKEMVSTFDLRRKYVLGRLRSVPGLACFEPQGAFYAFPNMSGLIGRYLPDGIPIKDATTLTAYFLHEHHLVMVPGKPFGAPNNFRLSFACSMDTLMQSMDRLQTAVEALK
jgi:aspartate aminotransferase